jgi:putative ubiquitin-RnfH superfamily antitoxin RatB of RatAB toxin-antitoxin module
MRVEVAYALPQKQQIIAIEVEEGCTVFEAAQRSGITRHFPELDLELADMGVFGRVVARPREERLHEGDRVEIYRPLIADPKEVRKARAANKEPRAAKKK